MIGTVYFIFIAKDQRGQRLIDEEALRKDVSLLVWIWIISATNPETLKLMPWKNAARADLLGGMPTVSAALFATIVATLENVPQLTIQIMYVRRHAALPDATPVAWNVQLSICLSLVSFAMRVLGRYVLACLENGKKEGEGDKEGEEEKQQLSLRGTGAEATADADENALNDTVLRMRQLEQRRSAAVVARDASTAETCRRESIALLTSATVGETKLAGGWQAVLRARADAAHLDTAQFDTSIAALQSMLEQQQQEEDGVEGLLPGSEGEKHEEEQLLSSFASSPELADLFTVIVAAEQTRDRSAEERNENERSLANQESESGMRRRDGMMVFLCLVLAAVLIAFAVHTYNDQMSDTRSHGVQIRLTNAVNPEPEYHWRGLLEASIDGAGYWGPICRHGFDELAVAAACRELGAPSIAPTHCMEGCGSICCDTRNGTDPALSYHGACHGCSQYSGCCQFYMDNAPDQVRWALYDGVEAQESIDDRALGLAPIGSRNSSMGTPKHSLCEATIIGDMRFVMEQVVCPENASSLTGACAFAVVEEDTPPHNAGCTPDQVVWIQCDTDLCPANTPSRHPPTPLPPPPPPACPTTDTAAAECIPLMDDLAARDDYLAAVPCGDPWDVACTGWAYSRGPLNQSCYADTDFGGTGVSPSIPEMRFTGADVEDMLWWCCEILVSTHERRYSLSLRSLGADISRYDWTGGDTPWTDGHWDYQNFVTFVLNDEYYYEDQLARRVRAALMVAPNRVQEGVFWVPRLSACTIGLRGYWTAPNGMYNSRVGSTTVGAAATSLSVSGMPEEALLITAVAILLLLMCCVVCWNKKVRGVRVRACAVVPLMVVGAYALYVVLFYALN